MLHLAVRTIHAGRPHGISPENHQLGTDEQETLSSSAARQKRAREQDSLVRRGDSASNGLAGVHLAPRGPLIPTWSKISLSKLTVLPSRHESPSSTGRTLPQDPPRSVTSSKGVCKTHHWRELRRPRSAVWGQPMPVLPSYLDFLPSSTRILLRGHLDRTNER